MPDAATGRWKLIAGLALLAAVMTVAVALWFVLSADGERIAASPEPIPIARAPEGPDRERPEDPGGTEIPDQDKQVYETFQAKADRPAERIERLLPAEEKPLDDPVPAPKADPAPEPAVSEPEPPKEEPTPAETAAEESEEEEETQQAAVPAPPPAPALTESPEPKPEAKPAPEPQVAVAAPSGTWQVQLAALRDEAAALATWKRIAGKQQALLGGQSPTISRVDTGSKGVFYRLRTGSFASRDQAEGFCQKLKAAGQDCLVAKAP